MNSQEILLTLDEMKILTQLAKEREELVELHGEKAVAANEMLGVDFGFYNDIKIKKITKKEINEFITSFDDDK